MILLAVASAEADVSVVRGLVDYAQARQAVFPQHLRAALLSGGPNRPDPLVIETLVDAESRFVREHDLPQSCLVLVRPDGYVARLSRDGDADLDAYLDAWLRPTDTKGSA